jgi:hypothetical protein
LFETLCMRRSWAFPRNWSQADTEPSVRSGGAESKASVCGLARKNSSRLSKPRTSASLVTILSDGCRLLDSRWPTYGVEVLIREATSSCVRSSSLRLLRITSPKLGSLGCAVDRTDLRFATFGSGDRAEFFAFVIALINIKELNTSKQAPASGYRTRRSCSGLPTYGLLYNVSRFRDFSALLRLVILF